MDMEIRQLLQVCTYVVGTKLNLAKQASMHLFLTVPMAAVDRFKIIKSRVVVSSLPTVAES